MGRGPGRKIARLLPAVAVLAATLAAPTAPATASGACAMDTYPVYTLDVQAKVLAKSYKVGEGAKLTVKVLRPAHHDPAGQNVQFDPPAQFPAEGVNVGVGLRIGDVFLYGWGTPTETEGESDVSIKLKPYTPAGRASLDVFAWKRQFEAPCIIIEEQGYLHMDNVFTVKK